MRIWERAYIESRLAVSEGAVKIEACRTAYTYGFEIDEIAQAANLPVWRVRQAVLGEAVNRTGDA